MDRRASRVLTGHRVFVTIFTGLAVASYVLLLLDAAPPFSLPVAAVVPFVLLGLPVILSVVGLGVIRLPFTALIQFLALHNAALLLVIKFGSGVRYRIDSPQLLAVTILLVEAFALLALARIVVRVVADIRSGTSFGVAFRSAFQQFVDQRLQNPLVRLALTEIRLIAAAFRWRKPTLGVSGNSYSFVVHSSSDLTYAVLAVGFLTLIEVPLVHLLVAGRNPVLAWIISGLSVYVLIWLVGLANSVRTFTSRVTPDYVHLQRGLYWSVRSPLANLVGAAIVPLEPGGLGTAGNSAPAADSKTRIRLEFAEPVQKSVLLSAPQLVSEASFRVPACQAEEILSRLDSGQNR